MPDASILVPVDGSANSDRAVRHAVALAKAGFADVLHVLNVQPSVGSLVSTFIARADIDSYHREEGEKAIASALKICADAGVKAEPHISVGRPGQIVADFARKLGALQVVLGTRGHGGIAGMVMGSVAQDVIGHVDVPVCLVK